MRGMGLGTCLAIRLTITDMCEMTLITGATLNAIKISTEKLITDQRACRNIALIEYCISNHLHA